MSNISWNVENATRDKNTHDISGIEFAESMGLFSTVENRNSIFHCMMCAFDASMKFKMFGGCDASIVPHSLASYIENKKLRKELEKADTKPVYHLVEVLGIAMIKDTEDSYLSYLLTRELVVMRMVFCFKVSENLNDYLKNTENIVKPIKDWISTASNRDSISLGDLIAMRERPPVFHCQATLSVYKRNLLEEIVMGKVENLVHLCNLSDTVYKYENEDILKEFNEHRSQLEEDHYETMLHIPYNNDTLKYHGLKEPIQSRTDTLIAKHVNCCFVSNLCAQQDHRTIKGKS